MTLAERNEQARAKLSGYYDCCDGCRKEFRVLLEKFAAARVAEFAAEVIGLLEPDVATKEERPVWKRRAQEALQVLKQKVEGCK